MAAATRKATSKRGAPKALIPLGERILEVAADPRGVRELADQLGVSYSSVYRCVRQLEDEGKLTRTPELDGKHLFVRAGVYAVPAREEGKEQSLPPPGLRLEVAELISRRGGEAYAILETSDRARSWRVRLILEPDD